MQKKITGHLRSHPLQRKKHSNGSNNISGSSICRPGIKILMYYPTQESMLPEPGRLQTLQMDYGNPLRKRTLFPSATISGHLSRRKLPCFPICACGSRKWIMEIHYRKGPCCIRQLFQGIVRGANCHVSPYGHTQDYRND